MSVEIFEPGSEITFLANSKDDVFEIEKSQMYKTMGQGVKTVEFIIYTGTRLRFIEAKKSVRTESKKDFKKYIDDICSKFAHSLDLFFAIMLGRKEDTFSEIPDKIKAVKIKCINIVLLLVIKECHKKYLTHITEELNRKLKRHRKTWNLEARAIHHETAVEWKLAKEA